MSHLFDFAVVTIFAREFLEGTIILGEYRTIISRGGPSVLEPGVSTQDAHRAVWTAAWVAIAVALLCIAAVAIPLSVLSNNFDDKTSKIIEGLSKMVAGVCLLQLSLKLPKFLGVYGSTKKKKQQPTTTTTATTKATSRQTTKSSSLSVRRKESSAASVATDTETRTENVTDSGTAPVQLGAQEIVVETDREHQQTTPVETTTATTTTTTAEPEAHAKLSLRNMRFNVAWNIWREVAECGVFLIPFFLSGDDLESIPLSAVVGAVVGSIMGWAIYIANRRFTDRRALAAFVAALLLVLSAGLFTGGMHNLEVETQSTRTVWTLHGDFWSIDRLPMTVLKPFGYNDSRTVLEICTYWAWLLLGCLLHYRKYKRAPKIQQEPVPSPDTETTTGDVEQGRVLSSSLSSSRE